MIIGPVLHDVTKLGLKGKNVDIATGFYTSRALLSLRICSEELRFMCRLDFTSIVEWKIGVIAPDVLLDLLINYRDEGGKVSLYTAPNAHAKVYMGSKAAFIGSANLTLRGFGGGLEVLQVIKSKSELTKLRRSLNKYAKLLKYTDLGELNEYVQMHKKKVARSKRKKGTEDRLPKTSRDQRIRLGTYQAFQVWLTHQPESSAKEIYERAHGKGNLQGHIHRNFYGLRQFLITYPDIMEEFRSKSPDTYKLSSDSIMESKLESFVKNHAVDEDDFILEIWKTYLPIECGRRAEKHGGTIGNLNRMLPLVARYMDESK